jgi:hypothetical protein
MQCGKSFTQILLAAIISFSFPNIAHAQQKPPGKDFLGWNFGAAISLTYDIGKNPRVIEAEVDGNNIIRLKKTANAKPRVLLESHYFFGAQSSGKNNNFMFGPFLAFQPGKDEVVEAIGGGIMIGLQPAGKTDIPTFNIGIGFIVDPNEQVLGAGLTRNAPLPKNDTLRFRTKDQIGALLTFSFSL